MKDLDCVEFLQWCLPKLRMRWVGFRKVRGQVCKRIQRRIKELDLPDIPAYKSYIENKKNEWKKLDSMCRITISRFYRDKGVFDALRDEILPEIARMARDQKEKTVRFWSAGCASGEEVFTLKILWELCIPESLREISTLSITATETDERLLDRARSACFQSSVLKDLPHELVEQAFEKKVDCYSLHSSFMERIDFIHQDIRKQIPQDLFHMIMCRNFVFTYYEKELQLKLLEDIEKRMQPGGFLVIGIHEKLPVEIDSLISVYARSCIYRKRSA